MESIFLPDRYQPDSPEDRIGSYTEWVRKSDHEAILKPLMSITKQNEAKVYWVRIVKPDGSPVVKDVDRLCVDYEPEVEGLEVFIPTVPALFNQQKQEQVDRYVDALDRANQQIEKLEFKLNYFEATVCGPDLVERPVSGVQRALSTHKVSELLTGYDDLRKRLYEMTENTRQLLESKSNLLGALTKDCNDENKKLRKTLKDTLKSLQDMIVLHNGAVQGKTDKEVFEAALTARDEAKAVLDGLS